MLDSQPQVLPILLGSGVSCAGHLPGVGLLSDAASAVFWGTTEEPLFGAIKGLCEEDRGGLPSNYEDWLYLAIQLRDHVRRDYENPGLIPFVSHLISHTSFTPEQLKETSEAIILSIMKTVCGALRSKDGRFQDAYPKLPQVLAGIAARSSASSP